MSDGLTGGTPYDRAFYAEIGPAAVRSAERILPIVIRSLAPRSIVDVGCGTGAWLAVASKLGIAEVLGIDGDHLDPGALLIPPERFREVDLTGPLPELGTFDLAMSLEVAEHLPPEHGDRLVASLVRLAPAVLFSAAVPGQGGVDHVNEQWPSYWAHRFADARYGCVDLVRPEVWWDPDVAYYYAQNTLLFVREDVLADRPLLPPARLDHPLDVVHPKLLEAARTPRSPSPPSLRSLARAAPGAVRRAVRRRRRRSG